MYEYDFQRVMKRKVIFVIIIILLLILSIVIASIAFMLKNSQTSQNEQENLVNEPTQNTTDNNLVESENTNTINNNLNGNMTANAMDDDFVIYEQEEARELVYSDNPEEVTNQTYFYTIQNCITTYLNDLAELQQDNFQDNEKKTKIYQQLSENYIQQNNITHDNLQNYIQIEDQVTFIGIVQMLQFQIKENSVIRFVLRAVFSTEDENAYYQNFIVYMDYTNLTYAIEPVSSSITDWSTVNLRADIEKIEKNGNNQYTYEVTTRDEVVNHYLQTFGKMCLNVPDVAYAYLDQEYKSQTMTDLDTFKEYVSQKSWRLQNVELAGYITQQMDGYTQYNCTDKMGNDYIIKETAIMHFTIILDAQE